MSKTMEEKIEDAKAVAVAAKTRWGTVDCPNCGGKLKVRNLGTSPRRSFGADQTQSEKPRMIIKCETPGCVKHNERKEKRLKEQKQKKEKE